MKAHKEVLAEQYVSSISLEAKTMLYMAESHIIPFMEKEITNKATLTASSFAKKRKEQLIIMLDELALALDELRMAYSKLNKEDESLAKGLLARETIVPLIDKIKGLINNYEKIASKDVYKLPTYPEMLY